MATKECTKCKAKNKVPQMVCCRNCENYFDRECAKELCDAAGEWAIRPTKLAKWSCTDCQTQPARVSCDECGRTTRGGSGSFVACGKCGRHLCRACAGLARSELARQQRGRTPWLCVSCCESAREVPASWSDDKVFAATYVRYATLWNPHPTEADLQHAYGAVGKALGLASPAQLRHRCRQFEHRVHTLLRRLAYRHRTPAEVLRHAPAWLREVEQRRNLLPAVFKSLWCPDEREEVLYELARRIRTTKYGHPRSWTKRMVRLVADRLGCPAPALMDIWTQMVHVALEKLQLLSLVGDDESVLPRSARLKPHEWLAADRALMHSGQKRAEWLVGYVNSQAWLRHVLLLLRLVQQYRLERPAPAGLRARWLSAYRHYTRSGLTSSVVVLQRRWWELKMQTRDAVRRGVRGLPRAMPPHLVLIARRYPEVVTQPFLCWTDLCKRNLVVDVTEEDVNKFTGDVTPLPVADDDLILREAKNLETSDDLPNAPTNIQENDDNHRQEVISQLKREVVELTTLNRMQNLNLEPLIQEYEADLSEIADENNKQPMDDSLSALEKMDPKKATTSIIFESDSDKEENGKSPKNEANNEIDDDCQIVETKLETCELSDDSDIVFKAEQTNVAVCIVSNKIEDKDDTEIKKDTNKIFVEDAIDPKLKMVPIVRLERMGELTSNLRFKRSRGVVISDKLSADKCSKASDKPLNVRAIMTLQNDIDVQVSVKGEAIGDEEKCHKESDSPSVKTRSGTPKHGEGLNEALQKQLKSYKIPDEDTLKSSHPDKGEGKSRERPWGYKGPLSGRVEDLSWLCTSISVALEKLPEEVLNNVKAHTAGRRVWLPDIEQVRRDNRRLLVAQVAPLPHGKEGVTSPLQHNTSLSCESSNTSESSTASSDDCGLLTQVPDDEESDWEISEGQLQQVLNDVQEKPLGAYCCLARRHRAVGDARRRVALRAGRAPADAEHDLHGAKHRSECSCCCRRLLAAPRSLGVLQGVLARSLAALLRRRAESSTSSDDSDVTDQRKRSTEDRNSSSDEERLVMDVPQPKKPTIPSKKKKRKRPSVERYKKRNVKKDEPKTKKKKPETKTNDDSDVERKKRDDDSDVERQKRDDYNEWMRQKHSHRRFFQPPGTTEKTIIYMTKQKDKVVAKNIGSSKEIELSRPDLQDHTYANTQSSETQATETAETETSNTNVAPMIGRNILEIQPTSVGQYTFDTHSNIPVGSTEIIGSDTNQHATSNQQVLQATPSTKEHTTSPLEIPHSRPNSDNQVNLNRVTSEPSKCAPLVNNPVQVLGTTFLPLAQQTLMPPWSSNVFVSPQVVAQSPQVSVNPVDSSQASYFMIYQPPAPAAPSVAIVPMTLTMQPEIAQVPEKKSIFQEDFRQKMVQNLTLLSGGGLLTEDEIRKESENLGDSSTSDVPKPASPKIFDEVPEGSNVFQEFPFTFPRAPRPQPLVSAVPNVGSLSNVYLPLPIMVSEPPEPPAPVLPTISSVMSLASVTTSLVDDDDDDCVITTPPGPKKIIIQPQKPTVPVRGGGIQYIKPELLYKELPQHISTFMGKEHGPFSLLRVNSEARLWALPEGALVLTDTAVACRNIRYFIINCKSLNRIVPVHFEAAAPAQGRIQVRAFAKLPTASASNLDDMMTRNDKLFKRLTNDPPLYARVLTALTDVVTGSLLLESGRALFVYRPRDDALELVRAARRRLRCRDARLALSIADCFNSCSNSDQPSKRWSVAPIDED